MPHSMEISKAPSVEAFSGEREESIAVPGGTLSIVVIFSVLILLFSETSLFMKTQTKHEMEVDVVRGGLLKINFDITFTRLPCSVLSLDAMDVSGEHELDVVHDVYKRKNDLDVVHDVYKRKVNKEGLPYGEVMSQKVDKEGLLYGEVMSQKGMRAGPG
ncbi:endoplasmic reticulum-golgi intermediate compartment-domain-containing protein [Baffinella frigidus]|nr:endoplasmic reticulum-golgi intermediate compartment-domain-containing protein [Cryptophyta sp. CCMP2293]